MKMEKVLLGDICGIQNGYAFDSSKFKQSTGMPLIRIRDIQKGVCSQYFDGEYDPSYIVRKGDLLIGMDGEFNIAEWSGEDALLNQRVCRLSPNDEVLEPGYLLHRIKQDLKRIEENTPSTTVKHISSKQIGGLEWCLPTIEKQRQIAARLKAQLAEVDKARQAAEAQLRDTRLLRARMLKAFFAELDAAPKKKLGDYAATTSGSTPSRGNKQYWQPAGIAWVKTGEVAFAPITATEEAISKTALAECSLTLLPPKSILIAMIGQGKTRGQSAILEIPATTNQNCFAILPNDTWEPDFLYLWMNASYQDLRDLSADRGGSQSALNGALLNALEVPAPSKTEQQHLVKRIQAAMTEIDAMENSSKAAMEDINRLPNRVLAQAFNPQGESDG